MRDVVFEWYIPYVPDKKKRLVKAVIVSAAVVFLIDAILFAAGLLFVSIALAAAGFFLSRSWKYEYEYVYVNGDFTISKIIRGEKRRDVYHVMRTDIEDFLPGRSGAEGRPEKDFTSGRPSASVYTIKAKGELVFIEPAADFVEEMSKFYHGQAGVRNG